MILTESTAREVQRRLNDAGASLIEDGKFGPASLAALFRYMGAGKYASPLGATASKDFAKYQVNTCLRIAHWFAQFGHESRNFTQYEEGLHYSAKRLCAVWPRRFPTLASAEPYANNPVDLANYVYGKRMGNTAPGDGYRYRGRGPQITGKENYRLAQRGTGLPLIACPELAADPENFTLLAGDYWDRQSCNRMADRDDLEGITQAVNGGRIGLAERRLLLIKINRVLV
jgi:putative chitinase